MPDSINMNTQDLRDRYIALNRSYSRVLIHHVGIDAGFFTEYTALVHAILYCLENHLQLKIYSKDANFGIEHGWTDYFEPFCEEVHESFHARYNKYTGITWRRLIFGLPLRKKWGTLKWKTKWEIYSWIGRYLSYRAYHQPTKLSYSIGTHQCRLYNIPQLDFSNDYILAFRAMSSIIWRLNPEMRKLVDANKRAIALPPNEPYIGCQIRGGDKITEVPLVSPAAYAQRIKQLGAKHVFVLTDDYTLFTQLQHDLPDISIHTLCQPSEHGYVNKQFNNQQRSTKLEQMARFFASMELLMRSSHFIGVITSAPSNFLIRMKFPHAEAIDCSRQELISKLNILPQDYLENTISTQGTKGSEN